MSLPCPYVHLCSLILWVSHRMGMDGMLSLCQVSLEKARSGRGSLPRHIWPWPTTGCSEEQGRGVWIVWCLLSLRVYEAFANVPWSMIRRSSGTGCPCLKLLYNLRRPPAVRKREMANWLDNEVRLYFTASQWEHPESFSSCTQTWAGVSSVCKTFGA